MNNRAPRWNQKVVGSYFILVLIKTIVLAAIFFCVLKYGAGVRVMYGNRGYPSVRDGDLVIYSIWNKEAVRQGDMVLYRTEEGTYCARVISAGGEEVDITNQGVVIDGSVLIEEVCYGTDAESVEIKLPVSVSEDEVFVLNDYRIDNRDSRIYGSIPKEDLVGRVIFQARWRGF